MSLLATGLAAAACSPCRPSPRPRRAPTPVYADLALDADGTSELAAMSYLGANAFSWSVFSYSPETGLAQVVTDGGGPLRLPDGGGSAGPSGYTCTGDQPGERLRWTTDGLLDVERSTPEVPVDDTWRAAYRVQDGVATQVEQSAADDAPREWLGASTRRASSGWSSGAPRAA